MATARMNTPRTITVAMLAGGAVIAFWQAWQGDLAKQALLAFAGTLLALAFLAFVVLYLYVGVIRMEPSKVLIVALIPYAIGIGLFAYGFSIMDKAGEIQRPNNSPASVVSVIYLSVATLTGLGYTDRYPVGDAAKVMAMMEVLSGLGYSVFIFSVLAGILPAEVSGDSGSQEGRNMEIKRAGTQASAKGPAEWFTGSVRVDALFQAPEPALVSGASVTFEPGARTAWHTHPLGQTLIVTAGCGWAQREGGPVEEIRPGDVVWFAPKEKHWHGATPTTAMTHIAIQERLDGKVVDWMEHVKDEQYRKE